MTEAATVSETRQRSMPVAIHNGTIDRVRHGGGFAFVHSDAPLSATDERELFVHRRAMSSAVKRQLSPGLRVMFNVRESARKPGLVEAVDVQLPGHPVNAQ